MEFLIKSLTWLPIVALGAVYVGALLVYINGASRILNLKILVVAAVVFRILYSALLSVVQYYVWSGQEFTRVLINSPLAKEVPLADFLRNSFSFLFDSELGYFLFYSWGHFWMNALLTIAAAFAFYGFLKVLKKRNDRFFYEGETELGLLMALVVGWPSFVIFVPLVFLAVVLVSIFRGLYLKEAYTTLGVPMLLAALITMIFGSNLISALGLTVLKI